MDHLNQRFTKVKGEDKLEIIMIKIGIKIDTSQTVEIGECHIEERAQYGQNYRRRSQCDQNYRSDFRRGNFRRCKIIEVRILEGDIEVNLEMTTLEEVEVDLNRRTVYR